ncbi:hypothetical protein CFIO01_13252 [Colletotrichum fioriniae PJ7]|uniref:Uncharacterized protein n=1 Tax=Colletotrichum fioriniae PJ7 TaxID=1445577 RepID=A0A010RY31_9PEZI|nr:hypothetical protein CFIO01_13252 [Colletotrichum fioriniae PJ7]
MLRTARAHLRILSPLRPVSLSLRVSQSSISPSINQPPRAHFFPSQSDASPDLLLPRKLPLSDSSSPAPHSTPTPTPVYTSCGNGSTNKASRPLPVATYLVAFPPSSFQSPSQQQQVRSPPAQHSTTYPYWVPVPCYRTAHRTEQTHTSAKETRALEPSASENPEFHPTLVLQLPRILPEPVKVPRCPTIYPSALSRRRYPSPLSPFPHITQTYGTLRVYHPFRLFSPFPCATLGPTSSARPAHTNPCAHAHAHAHTSTATLTLALFIWDLRARRFKKLLASSLAITTTAVTTTNSSYEVDLRLVAPARSIVERLGLELSTICHTSSREPEITPAPNLEQQHHLSTMTHRTTQHDAATSNVLAWSTHCANMPSMVEDESADVDEPPETQLPISPITSMFKRNPIRRTTLDHNASLLTKALHSPSEDEDPEARPGMSFFARRRSMASNISLASTADLTSDTGLTSPSRANTPSPPLPEMRLLNIHDEPAKEAPKKRCIQFACAAKPNKPVEPIRSQPMVKAPSAQEPQRRSCIKFACPVPQRPASTQNTPPQRMEMAAARLQAPAPATARKTRSRSPRPTLAPPQVDASVKSPTTKKYITANPSDLNNESSQFHEPSLPEQLSDSSIASHSSLRARRGRAQRIKIRPGTPELPDSTDFVCGTLDEDRPMEDAYMSCLAARRREKLQLIPQDIDPSFPASDPEDEGEEEIYNPVHHSSDDEMFFHGKMEDLHHKNDRSRRQKKAEHTPPKRFHSPPPIKRRASPAPKNRGRSPRRLFDGPSPRRLRSPAPQMLKSPPASPRNGHGAITFKTLASRPGLTVTKSLPRPPSMFPHMAKGRRSKAPANDLHIRGAIDIVKGLERKRQRRKEKFYQKYCNRARKGQVPERKPQRGLGCERMRELGLLMAGKIDQGNYVLSV